MRAEGKTDDNQTTSSGDDSYRQKRDRNNEVNFRGAPFPLGILFQNIKSNLYCLRVTCFLLPIFSGSEKMSQQSQTKSNGS